MYLHIGQDTVLRTQNIIGVFDLDNASQGKDTRNLLARREREGRVCAAGEGLPRSFILTGDERVYLTPISSGTMVKRANQRHMED